MSDANGDITYTTVGQSGKFVSISTVAAAWITLYSSEVARLSDSGRPFGNDPDPSSGVLAEFYIEAGQAVSVTPATFYFNDDATPTEALPPRRLYAGSLSATSLRHPPRARPRSRHRQSR